MTTGSETPGALLAQLRSGARTRSELVQLTGQSRPLVTAHLALLEGAGLVAEAAQPASTGGRPAVAYEFRAGGRLVLGVDLGVQHATLVVADLSGRVLADATHRLSIADGPDVVLPFVVTKLDDLLAGLGWTGPLAGIGLGLPGPVDQATGRLSSPPIMPGWDDVDVLGLLRDHFSCPAFVDNDANLHAVGELAVEYPGVDDLIFVKVASGVGAGIIVGGRLAHGTRGAAGDLGHIATPAAAGLRCRCGNTGCLEVIAGGLSIAQRLRDAGVDAAGPHEVAMLTRAGTIEAIRALRTAGEALGDVLSTCIALLNPRLIVLGGELSTVGEPLIAGVRYSIFSRALPLASRELEVVQSRTGRLGAALGAVYLVLDRVLSAEAVNRELAAAGS